MPDKIEIILVEDNKLFRETLFNFLNNNNFNCTYAFASCEEAISEINKQDIYPDVILLDIGLPGISGIEGIKPFKEIIEDVKIIMLTIQDDDDSILNAICNGASGYLLKDSPSEKIIESINEVLNGGAPMNSSISLKVLNMFREFVPEKKDYNLSERENSILILLTDGLSKKQISEKLFISYHTVDSHIRNIYEKLEVHSSSSAVAKALKENLI